MNDTAVSDHLPVESNEIYVRTARHYDRLNNLMSFGTSKWYRRRVVASLDAPPESTLVDLGCGTGHIALAMQERIGPEGRVVAIDSCLPMLAEAKRQGVREVMEGRLDAIPLDDEFADGLVCGYTIRYATDLESTMKEIHRILKPGAPVRFLEMTIPTSPMPRMLASILVRRLSPLAMTVFCRSRSAGDLMRHLWESVSSFRPPHDVIECMQAAGFQNVKHQGPWGMLMEYQGEA